MLVVLLDPNGDPIDSAIVSSSFKDTTSADGVFILVGLLPGIQNLRVQKLVSTLKWQM